ncbi:MAG: hypothetical protein HYY11_09860 [Candidatus Methylomirabilis oxyfera]|nr:hypothetical protein [Candidatus Methylomirabilis oxyfera]
MTEAKAEREAAKPVLFQDVAKQYMEWAREHRPRSIMFRDKALKHLLAASGPRPLTDLTRSEIEAYLARRRDSGAAPGTVNRERAVLRIASIGRSCGGWSRRTPSPGPSSMSN